MFVVIQIYGTKFLVLPTDIILLTTFSPSCLVPKPKKILQLVSPLPLTSVRHPPRCQTPTRCQKSKISRSSFLEFSKFDSIAKKRKHLYLYYMPHFFYICKLINIQLYYIQCSCSFTDIKGSA